MSRDSEDGVVHRTRDGETEAFMDRLAHFAERGLAASAALRAAAMSTSDEPRASDGEFAGGLPVGWVGDIPVSAELDAVVTAVLAEVARLGPEAWRNTSFDVRIVEGEILRNGVDGFKTLLSGDDLHTLAALTIQQAIRVLKVPA